MSDFESRVRARLPEGVTLVYVEAVDSTNRLARERVLADAPDGTLVLADRQKAGRGQGERWWHSPPGVGAWMTLILRPDAPARVASLLPLAAGVGVAESLEAVSGVALHLKWPNDVLAGDRKVCGILAESATNADRLAWVLIGIGINVCQRNEEFPIALHGRAVSLWGAGGRAVSREEVIGVVVAAVRERAASLETGTGAGVVDAFNARSYLTDRLVVLEADGAAVTGRCRGVDAEGGLVVEADGGRRTFRSGHVRLIDA